MCGATVFSTLNLKGGYHRIQKGPNDQNKTVFTLEREHYEFNKIPFELKNDPVTFQRLMDEFLRGIDESVCKIYMEDLLVFSKTETVNMRLL